MDSPALAARLATSFLEASGVDAAPPDLGERLLAHLEAARAAHPGIGVDGDGFVRHLARRLPEGAGVDAWLASVCAGDLYLACGCAEGVPAAIEALDRLLSSHVGAFLVGLRPTPDFVDDVAQAVREHLLVGVDGSPPRIAEYAGRGSLAGWLRVVTVRIALAVRRKRTEVLAGDDPAAGSSNEQPAPADPEAEILKRRYEDEFNAAFRAALGALTVRQRDLLRRHFVERATLDQLAATLRVGRATVARWIAAAREEVLAGARRRLVEKLGLRPAELDSLMVVMRSRLDLSLSQGFARAS
jgi:RNA polymerase sigma-70 factor (ECF subfamily)